MEPHRIEVQTESKNPEKPISPVGFPERPLRWRGLEMSNVLERRVPGDPEIDEALLLEIKKR